ncbi:hypothetical protein CN109_35965, partial [Sinorhizobium meliloti]
PIHSPSSPNRDHLSRHPDRRAFPSKLSRHSFPILTGRRQGAPPYRRIFPLWTRQRLSSSVRGTTLAGLASRRPIWPLVHLGGLTVK